VAQEAALLGRFWNLGRTCSL